MNFIIKLYVGGLILLALNTVSSGYTEAPIVPNMVTSSINWVCTDSTELTPENVYRAIVSEGIVCPDIVWKQCMLETGKLTSKISKENHNLFGMKNPRVRPTTSLGQSRGHAKYSSWCESVKDYKLWQDRKPVESSNYYNYLAKRGYAADPNYIVKLKGMKVPDWLKFVRVCGKTQKAAFISFGS